MRGTALVVEDNEFLREMFKALLTSMKIFEKILVAADYKEAVSLIERNYTTLDLVVTDYEFPYGNGLEVIRFVKLKEKAIRTILISGKEDVYGFSLKELAEKAGADRFLKKPFENKEFQRTIKDLLGYSSVV